MKIGMPEDSVGIARHLWASGIHLQASVLLAIPQPRNDAHNAVLLTAGPGGVGSLG